MTEAVLLTDGVGVQHAACSAVCSRHGGSDDTGSQPPDRLHQLPAAEAGCRHCQCTGARQQPGMSRLSPVDIGRSVGAKLLSKVLGGQHR